MLQSRSAISRKYMVEVNMKRRNAMVVIAFGLVISSSGCPAWSEEGDQAALINAIGGARITLLQGISQVAKGSEVPTEAKYELEDGKLMLSVYTSAKGFNTAAEDNSFNEYGGDAAAATWAPKKEVFTDLKHIARSAQYHTLLSMTNMTIPTIIEKASKDGMVLSVKEKVRNGKTVFDVMTVKGNTVNTTFYDLATGNPTAG
jgi:hypothetical protein